jgi:hypothetical protein
MITPPKSIEMKLVESTITKLPKATQTIAKEPINRKPYLFIRTPAGIAIKTPGITMDETRSPAVPALTLNTDCIFVIRGGIDSSEK